MFKINNIIPSFLPFLLLHSLHSIWQLASTVLPPSRQGVMWSPSICSKGNSFWQWGHMWCCFSHTASFMSSGKGVGGEMK